LFIALAFIHSTKECHISMLDILEEYYEANERLPRALEFSRFVRKKHEESRAKINEVRHITRLNMFLQNFRKKMIKVWTQKLVT